jgi:hypothetical protein
VRFRAFFLLIALLLAACGGSGTSEVDDPDQTDDQTTTTTAAVEDDDETETSTGTGLPSNECVSLGMALSQAAGLGAFGQGGDPGDAADSLMALAGAAPAEIADDFEVMAAAFAEFAQTLADAGVDFSDPATLQSTEGQAALIAASEAFSAPEVQEASENMSDYLEEVCEG